MKQDEHVHTVPVEGRGWANTFGGRLITRHRTREDAVVAGAAIAQSLGVEQRIHEHHADDDRDTAPPADDPAAPRD